jgi:hypothetical protein
VQKESISKNKTKKEGEKMTHKTTYQTHSNISHSTNAIAERKKHSDMIAQMKAEGTYCDLVNPDRSFKNFKLTTCKTCPNSEECEEKSENESRNILKFRRNILKKSKIKRKIKGRK